MVQVLLQLPGKAQHPPGSTGWGCTCSSGRASPSPGLPPWPAGLAWRSKRSTSGRSWRSLPGRSERRMLVCPVSMISFLIPEADSETEVQMQEVLVSCQRARLRWRGEVGGLKYFSFKCFQSCFPWSRNTCSGWMPGKQLHHREVLLEGGVKGGLCQRPGHWRHWALGASWDWEI